MRKKILIADDSMIARRMVSGHFASYDVDIVEAHDGVDALEKIRTEKPDLILLDLLMPNKDGFEVLQMMKGMKLNIPVIVLTADIQDEARQECMDLGASAFMNKPPNGETLLSYVNDLIMSDSHGN